MNKEEVIKLAFDSMLDADEDKAMEVMDKASEIGLDLLELLKDGFTPGITALGDKFGAGEIFLPELIYGAEVMRMVTERVEAEMAGSGKQIEKKGRFLMATVEGDVHDIGKGICCSLMKAAGIEVIDLGREVKSDTIIEKAIELDADIIGTSALLTTTMIYQQELEEKLAERGLKARFKTMIGGAPVTQRWADKIKADAFTEDASECCTRAKQFISEKYDA